VQYVLAVEKSTFRGSHELFKYKYINSIIGDNFCYFILFKLTALIKLYLITTEVFSSY